MSFRPSDASTPAYVAPWRREQGGGEGVFDSFQFALKHFQHDKRIRIHRHRPCGRAGASPESDAIRTALTDEVLHEAAWAHFESELPSYEAMRNVLVKRLSDALAASPGAGTLDGTTIDNAVTAYTNEDVRQQIEGEEPDVEACRAAAREVLMEAWTQTESDHRPRADADTARSFDGENPQATAKVGPSDDEPGRIPPAPGAGTTPPARIELGRGVWRCGACKAIHAPNEEIADDLDALIQKHLAADPPASPLPDETESLKPCPFCGGEASIIAVKEASNVGGFVVQCGSCEASTRVWFPAKDPVDRILREAWNRRPASPLPTDTRLTPDEQRRFLELLENPPEPSEELVRLFKKHQAASPLPPPTDWQPIETFPITLKNDKAWFWIVPKSPDETYVDGSGRPIMTSFEPYAFHGQYGGWSALIKATHWQPFYTPPPPRSPARDA